jgi:hypothetical protein
MTPSQPQIEALTLLRALFELAEADVRPTSDLLIRLLGYSTADIVAYIAHLRRTRLVQPQSLGLTFSGLAVATNLPEFELAAADRSRLTSNAA